MFQLPFRIFRIFHMVTHQSGLIVRIYCENLVFVNRVPFDENTVNLLCRNKAAHSSVQLHFELNDNVFVYSRRVTSVITIHPEGRRTFHEKIHPAVVDPVTNCQSAAGGS